MLAATGVLAFMCRYNYAFLWRPPLLYVVLKTLVSNSLLMLVSVSVRCNFSWEGFRLCDFFVDGDGTIFGASSY